MRKRRVVVAIAVVFAGALVWFWWAASPPIFQPELCERIRPGMNRAEVEAVIGWPPDDYRTHRGTCLLSVAQELQRGPAPRKISWAGNQGTLGVILDENNIVVWAYFDATDVFRVNPSFDPVNLRWKCFKQRLGWNN